MKTVIIIKNSKTLQGIAHTALFSAGTLTLFCYLIFSPVSAAQSARNALSVCAVSLIPSLFPFTVLVGIMNSTGLSVKIASVIGTPLEKLLGIGRHEVCALLLGCTGGFPIGAICVRELRDNGHLSTKDAERLLALSSCASPTFCIAAIGTAMFGSRAFGVKLYLCQITAILIIAMFMRPSKPGATVAPMPKNQPLSTALTSSVCSAGMTMIKVCAFAVFFAVIGDAVCSVVAEYSGKSAAAVTASIMELTLAARRISELDGTTAATMTAFAVGWSGISVHMQIASVIYGSDIKMTLFCKVKLLHGLISALLMFAVCSLN